MMPTATKSGRQSIKRKTATPSRDEVIAMVRELGGDVEVKRYEQAEGLEKTHGQEDVLHRWKIGSIMAPSFAEHDDETIRIYSIGLQRSALMLRLSVRLAELYKESKLRELLNAAAKAKHELTWNHFRRLMAEGLSDGQRADLVSRVIQGRWGYRELEAEITKIRGGKRSKGGRKPGQPKYKTFAGAIEAMTLRSQAWIKLDDKWIDQVNALAAKMSDDEKQTPEFLSFTEKAAKQLRDLASKALNDAEAAEAIAREVKLAMGDPDLTEEVVDDEPVKANGRHKANGKPKGSRPRLAKIVTRKSASAN
jgi:hypothetical protein